MFNKVLINNTAMYKYIYSFKIFVKPWHTIKFIDAALVSSGMKNKRKQIMS